MTTDIDDDAVRWIARRTSGEMNEREKAAYQEWLAADPRHSSAIASLETMLGGL